MSKATLISLIIIGLIILFIAIFVLVSYINLNKLRKNVSNKWEDIREVLKVRLSLIPLMVEIIKENALGNVDVLKSVIAARNKFNAANTNKQGMEASNMLSDAIRKFMTLEKEDMKMYEEFLGLKESLIENQENVDNLTLSYNEEANKYNLKINKFPFKLVAKIFKFKKEDVF